MQPTPPKRAPDAALARTGRHAVRKPAFNRAAARIFMALSMAVAMLAAIPQGAAAAPYASYVMDARTGQTLHESSPDRRLHPASLTKMMTLYLTIEAVKAGRLRLDQKVRISSKAAKQPPSRIGLRAGERVSIRNLIRAAAVKSANDAAMALAEAVGGSQEGFARMMTQRARSLGMPNTTFRNPHGLTQNGHLSTARDMAVLGRRLFFDHPEYYNLFSRQKTVAMGRTVRNTNRRLLAAYRGADGIKTGYTRAAGFNLVASARRGEKHVIVAVYGGRSSRSRNAEVARLLDLGFKLSPGKAPIIKPGMASTLVASAPFPVEKPNAPDTLTDLVLKAIGPAQAAASEAPRMSRSTHAPRRSDIPRARPAPRVIGVAMVVEFPTPRPR